MSTPRVCKTTLSLALLLLTTNVAWSASFDCAKAVTNSEKMICENKKLSESDEKMARIYKKMLEISPDPQELKKQQKLWIKSKRDVCLDTLCMTKAYEKRMSELDLYITAHLIEDLITIEKHQWGQYRIVVEEPAGEYEREQLFDQGGFYNRVLIQDKRGQVLREIRSSDALITKVNFVEITGSGLPELHIMNHGGGSCCYEEYYFTQDGGLRNLLIFEGGHHRIHEVKDLNGDGRPEIIAYSDALTYFGELCRLCTPLVEMVIGWDGKAYRDQTKAYPRLARKQAQKYKAEFLKAVPKVREWDSEALEYRLYENDSKKITALGYYANSLVTGEGAVARAWLLQHADKETRKWLLSHEKDLPRLDDLAGHRIHVSQEGIIQFKGGGR